MAVIYKSYLCVVLALLFTWCHVTEVTSIPTFNTNIQENMDAVFGEHKPKPGIFSSIGRDTTSAKTYMLGLYNYAQEKEKEASRGEVNYTVTGNNTTRVVDDADTIVSFVNHAYIPRPNASDEEGAMFFDVQSNLVVESTLASEIRIYLDITKKTLKNWFFKVTVYQIVIPKKRYLVLTSRIVNATRSMWHEFDVLKAANVWRENSINNNGILVVCETLNKVARTFKECGLVDFTGKTENRPFLVSFYQSGDEDEILAEQLPEDEEEGANAYQGGRARRSLQDLFPRASKSMPGLFNKGNRTSTACGRHPLYVSFKDLGWSGWIIAPEGYKAAYCDGECGFPLHDKMNASNHAIVQTLVHMIVPSHIPEPCCAPVRQEPLKVLYLDEYNNIIMKTYSNMIVNDCGCQ